MYAKAKKAHIPCALITDAGRTEFGWVPTNTCIGIGPYFCEDIDKITVDLKLLLKNYLRKKKKILNL